MPIKYYKPTTPARRHTSVMDSSDIDKVKPQRRLIVKGKKFAGRNVRGKITVRHQGGGSSKLLRQIDFKRDKFDIEAKVQSVEYDPSRNARIALVAYSDGEKRYIIVPQGLKKGDKIMNSKKLIELKPGNQMPLKVIPSGMFVYNIELTPGGGGKIARSAGNNAYLMAVDSGFAQLKMPSGEIRLVPEDCMAAVGSVGNADYKNIRWGKAGRMRHRGIRPTVRGKVMNPVDHPHGGGEAKNSIGMKHPKTPWGKPALGVKTRKNNKQSNRLIIKRRKKRKKK